ncbi:translation initiation factor eIF-2B subunit epsilon-like [Anopheles maculipalpis]|uniref:translation initiation factor eIF-2B subunit epsilon-like n=1 Tax=Anopheles maculipalpis TaxID=1496333 RepID=UPI00215980BD|nr:translation initiation factor eIF-2B subunit epsilon-like [Anopheles maculipalpis]
MSKATAVENKEIFQAIVIADSHNDNLQPFTSRKPLALLPIANVPLIEYTLESLSRNGVEEVIVFCCNHIEQVKRYVQERQTARCTWSIHMKVSIVSSESCRSIGEAIRDLEARNTIRGNVLLLGVDSVTNADLAALLDEHKRLVKLDRGAVMTVVYKEGLRRMRTGNEVMIAMEPRTRRLLYHQRLAAQEKERNFEVPLELFLGNRDVEVCHGLLDPQIAVCSQAALPLFADNFDFLSRDDFVRGVLINEEILNSRIYVAKLAREEYAMRVNNWQSYQLVSLDVINRWLYPMVPDTAISEFRQQYKHFRNNIYRHGNVRLNRSCELDGDLVVGEESDIREGTYLRQSVVGRGCQIGRNCRIVNSFLMEGAIVGDGTVLNHCIVGEGVKVGEGCTINPGTVLGDGVEIPDRLVVAGLLLQADEPPADEWGAPVQKIADRAYTIPVVDDEDSDSDEEDTKLGQPAMNQPIMIAPLPERYPPSLYEPSDDEADSNPASPVPEDENIFLSEVVESLKRGFSERTNAEYLILEINSSRYAYNMALCEVNYYVVKAILQIMLLQDGVATNTVGTLRRLLEYFGVVFRNYIRDREAMRNCLRAFEDMCSSSETVRAKLPQLVHYLYEEDLIGEEAIIEWYEALEDNALKTILSKLVQWLQESSEEEDEDEED